jgi:hypothetical protein
MAANRRLPHGPPAFPTTAAIPAGVSAAGTACYLRMKKTQGEAMRQRLGVIVLLGVGMAGAAQAQGAGRFDGQYSGELALTKIIGGDCTKPPLGAAYPLTIAGGTVQFKYVPRFDTVLTGRVDRNGNFRASRTVKSGTIAMTGHTDGSRLTATIVSPSCVYSYTARY